MHCVVTRDPALLRGALQTGNASGGIAGEIAKQVGALFDALPEIARRAEQVWMPQVLGWLDIEAGDDVVELGAAAMLMTSELGLTLAA